MSSQHIFNGVKFSRLIAIFMCLILQLPKEISSANQPSLEIIPTPPEEQSEKDLIYLRPSYNATIWSNRIENSLAEYYTVGRQGRDRLYACSDNNPAPKGFTCEVDVRLFGVCGRENYFGYHRYSPCVFLKVNATPGWVPEFYNSTSDLPIDMPEEIRTRISVAIETQNLSKLKTLWVSCDGDWAADKEFIGPVDYYPERGFPGYYFPRDESNYLSPLVAVHFKRARAGVVINIECRLWAKNIQYDREKKLGYKLFQLLMD